MAELTIITNNVPRDTIDAWQLTEKEQAQFDYLDWDAIKDGSDSATFIRYKGELIDLSEFLRLHNHGIVQMARDGGMDAWDGYRSDSFFSGYLIKWHGDDGEQVIMGRYYS